jgi:hypothetical protein
MVSFVYRSITTFDICTPFAQLSGTKYILPLATRLPVSSFPFPLHVGRPSRPPPCQQGSQDGASHIVDRQPDKGRATANSMRSPTSAEPSRGCITTSDVPQTPGPQPPPLVASGAVESKLSTPTLSVGNTPLMSMEMALSLNAASHSVEPSRRARSHANTAPRQAALRDASQPNRVVHVGRHLCPVGLALGLVRKNTSFPPTVYGIHHWPVVLEDVAATQQRAFVPWKSWAQRASEGLLHWEPVQQVRRRRGSHRHVIRGVGGAGISEGVNATKYMM